MGMFQMAEMNGIRLHVLPTQQFKTFSLSAYIGQPLSGDTVTKTALVPYVLRRGTERYPETKQFRERLDELYGAGFGFDVMKRGHYQMIVLRMDIVNDRFVAKESESNLAQSLQFLSDAICRPALENGHFREDYVATEKETLRKRIEAVINDKIKYAAERCISEMCGEDPYHLFSLGRIEDITAIDAASLYKFYGDWLRSAPIDLYVVGDTSLEEVQQILSRSFILERDAAGSSYQPMESVHHEAREHVCTEQLDVKQGKLNMGIWANTVYADDDYVAALVYNGILGGYPHSKLFTNVREKESLAYYASSRFDGHKGIITIQTGIEVENKDKAEAIIREQLKSLRQGDISETEMNQTKAMIIHSIQEMNDSAFDLISYDMNGVMSGNTRTRSELIEAVRLIDTEAVKRIADKISLDTIYFLRDRTGGLK